MMNSVLFPSERSPNAQRSPASWYHPPQLMVMTGFIANTTDGIWGRDFLVRGVWTPEGQQEAIRAWRQDIGRDYDPDASVRMFKEAGASGVIFYDKWHDGLVCHHTALTGFRTERDLLGETIAALRRNRMRIVVYYSLGLDYNPELQGRDWVCRDASGQALGLAFPADWQSFHSPYRRYVVDQLAEILNAYGSVDGVWLDILGQPGAFYRKAYGWTGPEVSHDTHTRAAFEDRFKKPLEEATGEDMTLFHTMTLEETIEAIRSTLTRIQPDIRLSWNGAGRDDCAHPRRSRRVDGAMDWFSMEGHLRPHIQRSAWISQGADRPVEAGMLVNSSWYAPVDDAPPPPGMTSTEALTAAATAWIHGINLYAALTPGHSGRYDMEGDIRLLRHIGQWLEKHRPGLTGSRPYADIGVIAGNPDPDAPEIPLRHQLWPSSHRMLSPLPPVGELGDQPGLEWHALFQEMGYMTERVGSQFAAESWNLTDYRMIVLPENALLRDHDIEAIRAYVKQGGRLLACGHASLFDGGGRRRSEFGLSDVFGAALDRPLPGYKRWIQGTAITVALQAHPAALGVRLTTGAALARWSGADAAPALVENASGQGSSLYVTTEERAITQNPLFLREVTGYLIGAPPLTLSGSHRFTFFMRRKKDDTLLYLIGEYKEEEGAALLEIVFNPPFADTLIGVESLPDGRKIPVEEDADRRRVTLTEVSPVFALRLKRR